MSKKRFVHGALVAFLVLILILAGLTMVPSVFSSQTSYSDATTLSILSGEVSIMKGDTGEWLEAKDSMTLAVEDGVRTGVDSRALITFFEGTTMTLEPETEITIRQIDRLPQTDSTLVRLKQKTGQTWNRVQKLTDSASRYEIETEAAVAAVRGTTIELVVGGDSRTTMRVFEGEGSLTAQGVSVVVPAGKQSIVEQGAQPAAVTPIAVMRSMLRLSVNASAWMMVVDPAECSAGRVSPGINVNQIPGVITSGYGAEVQSIEIPDPKSGTYRIVLASRESGEINLLVEGFVWNGTDFTQVFRQQRQQTSSKDDRWRIDFQAETIDGILDRIDLPTRIEPLKGDMPGKVSVTQAGVDGRIAELAGRFDWKYAAFKSAVYAAVPNEEVVLAFTEEEVFGKLAKWVNGPDNPVDLYDIEAELNSDGVAQASAKFKYGIFRGEVKVRARVEIEAANPRIEIASIDIELGKLPLPLSPFKSRINDEAKDISWELDADLTGVDMGDEQIVLNRAESD